MCTVSTPLSGTPAMCLAAGMTVQSSGTLSVASPPPGTQPPLRPWGGDHSAYQVRPYVMTPSGQIPPQTGASTASIIKVRFNNSFICHKNVSIFF